MYVETVGDKPEFYDLKKDPYQMENAVDLAEYQPIIEQMRVKLAELRASSVQEPTVQDGE